MIMNPKKLLFGKTTSAGKNTINPKSFIYIIDFLNFLPLRVKSHAKLAFGKR